MASTNQNDSEPISTAIQGRVKWFNVKAGYGFIKRNDNSDDIFVHKASILRPNPEHMIPSLDDSEEVIFDIIQSSKGFEAVNVTGPGRSNVIGNSRAHRRYRRGSNRGYFSGENVFGGNSGGYSRGGYNVGNTMFSGDGPMMRGSGSRGYYRGPRGDSQRMYGRGGRGSYYSSGPRVRGGRRGSGNGRIGEFSGARFNQNEVFN